MTSNEWAAVAVVVGGGILLQIPGHNEIEMDHAAMESGETPADMAVAAGPYEQVALDVKGMT
jgi:hypothetical protein